MRGDPARLSENRAKAFLGCKLRGAGFVVDSETAKSWISRQQEARNVVFPYFTGDDIYDLVEMKASRMAVDFSGLTEREAAHYQEIYNHLFNTVRLQRMSLGARKLRDEWWHFESAAWGLRRAIREMDEALAFAEVSSTIIPRRVKLGPLYNHKVILIASDSYSDQAVLSSSAHWLWVVKYSTTNRVDPSYSPSVAFETFPRPMSTVRLSDIGWDLERNRSRIMSRRGLGLTKLYNLVNDPGVADSDDRDVAWMREIHVELDRAVMEAYGWSDLALDHGFHTYRQMTRWTVSPAARVEILDRLLEENHRRAALQGDAPPGGDDDGDEAEGDAE